MACMRMTTVTRCHMRGCKTIADRTPTVSTVPRKADKNRRSFCYTRSRPLVEIKPANLHLNSPSAKVRVDRKAVISAKASKCTEDYGGGQLGDGKGDTERQLVMVSKNAKSSRITIETGAWGLTVVSPILRDGDKVIVGIATYLQRSSLNIIDVERRQHRSLLFACRYLH